MAHRVQSVSMIDQNILQAIFIGGEVIQYDLRKMLSILPQFQEIINDPSLASKVHADTGGYGVSWSDDLDLDSETIWEDGVFIRIESVDPSLALASSLARAREYAMLTQKQLSEKTGIYQSDISKLERGNANPSILTLKRLADAMDMTLKIEFVPKKMKRLSQPLSFSFQIIFSLLAKINIFSFFANRFLLLTFLYHNHRENDVLRRPFYRQQPFPDSHFPHS